MTKKDLLIVFVKNLIPGHVKTRLAKDIGIDGALDVYKYLIEHTYEVTKELDCSKAVFYSEYVEIEDIWDTDEYKLLVQKGPDLGDRMLNAFKYAFDKGCEKAVIIGTDCWELSDEVVQEAFDKLDDHDVVIGPATDGGYYLIGMNKLYPGLFHDKKYSHDNVLKDVLTEIGQMDAEFHLLPELSDIDTFQDLKDSDIDFEFVEPDDEG
ncbi:TIGR04282 family arsenosugar biosynthesis glycosyltransferase [Marinoscillum sp.]|uniref:TIGR04282 family arsenosugar biosynthesis glycosyltransferase n=1 Tax=Marinoscillum sp. TaxID=2024838 RepID=UPI003BA8EE10